MHFLDVFPICNVGADVRVSIFEFQTQLPPGIYRKPTNGSGNLHTHTHTHTPIHTNTHTHTYSN